ncbi:hypothetical protein G7Y89_g12018 [Cudoniella acicularis]|uniref:2EXR domain-containing protein n=1 Tax=Cudoniella acicularis TaxID=354080 RepID=A0A8H4W029_9HELO|nr:hypothetical protein G7Y89_g12018 [Cudoniella acicularis]
MVASNVTLPGGPVNLPNLPYELRRQIWEFTFEPREIHFNVKSARLAQAGRIFLYHLVVQEIEKPVAFSVCYESRDFAQIRYRRWRLRNKDGKVGTIFWYPTIDVVTLLHAPSPSVPGMAFSIFAAQFPYEVKEVQRLALPTSLYPVDQHFNVTHIWPLIDFTNLRELLITVDREHEQNVRNPPGTQRPLASQWSVPFNINGHIDFLRVHYENFGPEYHPLGPKPTVRVVGDQSRILSSDDLVLML